MRASSGVRFMWKIAFLWYTPWFIPMTTCWQGDLIGITKRGHLSFKLLAPFGHLSTKRKFPNGGFLVIAL